MFKWINNLFARTDGVTVDDLALVVTLKGSGPSPGVIDVIVDGIAGIEDTGNSRATPLAAAAVFTGTIFDADDYSTFSLSALADAASAPGGLLLAWFEDAAGTVPVGSEAYTVFANVNFQLKLNHKSRYFRVIYTNNVSTPQTSFSLRVYHKAVPVEDQIVPFGGSGMFGNLGNAGTLNSPVVDVRNFASVSISLTAVQASAANGLQLQWSMDGVIFNAIDAISFTIAAGDEFFVEIPHRGRFFRVTYTNGAVTGVVTYQMIHRRVATPACRTGGFANTITRVAANVAAVQLLAANYRRVSALITNYSPGNSILYVKTGASPNIGAGTESFTAIIQPSGSFRLDLNEYYGPIFGIWSAADAAGAALITENNAP